MALQGGNSDPFSATAITITPQINQVLTFVRDVCLPAFYFTDSLRDPSISTRVNRDVANSSGWISSPAAQLGWQQVIDALDDKCTALACLSTWLALMATCNIQASKATEASLKMRAASSALLRQRLLMYKTSKLDIHARQEILWQVFWHLYAEFFAGNMIAAQVHGKMLRQSCETAEEGVITDHFLDSVIYVDSHMAARYLVRPVLDVNAWVPKVFESAWQPIDSNIVDMTNENGEHLHPTIAQPMLRQIFIRTKQAIILLQRVDEAKSRGIDPETIYYWLNSHAYVDSGRLIDRYLKVVEVVMASPNDEIEASRQSSESLGTLHTETALCLAALFAIRNIGQEVRINGVDVVDASATIMKHLKEAVEQALAHCTTEEKHSYRAAHLWCAYMGALNEQRLSLCHDREIVPPKPKEKIGGMPISLSSPGPVESQPSQKMQLSFLEPSSMHFNHLLAELAHSLDLVSWHQVYDLLKRFIFSDLSEPNGSRWFWKTMGAYLDRRGAREAEERRRSVEAGTPSSMDQDFPLPVRGAAFSSIHGQAQDTRRLSSVSSSGRFDPMGHRRSWTSDRRESESWNMTRTNSYGGGTLVQRPPQRKASERQGYG